jgi:hypothetical protein
MVLAWMVFIMDFNKYIIDNHVDGVCYVEPDVLIKLLGTYELSTEYFPSPPRYKVQEESYSKGLFSYSHTPAKYEYNFNCPNYLKRIKEFEARKCKKPVRSFMTSLGPVELRVKRD